MPNPLFSIIVTTYNRKDELERCLKSLENQTYKNFEVFVYDDGSVDETKGWVEEQQERYEKAFVRFSYVWGKNWGGPAKGRNAGLEWAKGEWCSFLDCDDWWNTDRLERVLPFTENYDVVFHELLFANKDGDLKRNTNGRHLKGNVFSDLLTKGNCLSNSATSFKTKLAKSVGGVSEDENLKAVEDYDLWLKLAKVTERFYYIKDILGRYWVGDDNISASSHSYIKKIHFIVDKYLKDLNEEDRKEALNRRDYITARNLENLGDEAILEARNLFKKVFFNSKTFSLRIKSLYLYLKI